VVVIKAKGYQLLSQEGIIFRPDLTDRQKFEFNKMALLSGPKIKAKKILEKCVGIGKDLEKLALEITHCGMDKRRTWKLSLIGNDDVNSNTRIDIKLGKENVLQQLERFIQVFSGKLKKYLSSIEYADLRYSNGFSIKWNANDTLDNALNDVSKDKSSGNNL
jgi:cell division protein FtsQ